MDALVPGFITFGTKFAYTCQLYTNYHLLSLKTPRVSPSVQRTISVSAEPTLSTEVDNLVVCLACLHLSNATKAALNQLPL